MTFDATAIVLAGGRSRRMGRDKSLIDVDGEPLVGRVVRQLRPFFDRILIGAADDGKYDFLGLPIIPDQKPDCGPMMGLASTLTASEDEVNFVMACDMPDVNVDLMKTLVSFADGFDCVVPYLGDDKYEPLFAVYKKTVLPDVLDLLASDRRRLSLLFDRVRTRLVEIDETKRCINLNNEDDLNEWRSRNHDTI